MKAATEPDLSVVACLVALASLPGVGPSTVLAVHEAGDPAGVWEAICRGRGRQRPELAGIDREVPGDEARTAAAADRWRARETCARATDPAQLLAAHQAGGMQVLVRGAPGYPDRLAADPAPPALLFVRGDPAAFGGPSVAIVGTRNATRTGRATAAGLAQDLTERGVSVVSGLALGIDGAAHLAAVAACEDRRRAGDRSLLGVPIGVVASGLDRPYPRRHDVLHRQVGALGVLVTESPLGGAPVRWRFPARNRIIAGLADAVVVVESRSAGGSMLTAAEALKRDVPVLAVPGHPNAPAAAGALDLLFDGAAPVRDVDDVLVAIGLGGRPRRATAAWPASGSDPACGWPPLSPSARLVVDAAAQPCTFAEVVAATGLSVEQVAEDLLDLEARQLISRQGGWFEAVVQP